MLFAVMLMGTSSFAATLDWSALGWSPDGALSQQYVNVDNSGIDINVTMTGDTGRFIGSTPNENATYGLDYYLDFDTNTEAVTTTIKFSSPVKLTALRWIDIDSDTFNDRIIVSAKDTTGATVLLK